MNKGINRLKTLNFIPLFFLVLAGCSNLTVSQNDIFLIDELLVNKVLDGFHKAASESDSNTYFSSFTENATFIGTDPNETWTLKAFKSYAQPYFMKGKGWTYTPRDRHIYFSQSLQTAWFDEMLDNDKYGETRGTGVLVKTKRGWKIAQYHLTLPIPNSITTDVVKLIQPNE